MEVGCASSDDASDRQSERCGSYSPSADVSESDSCSDFSSRGFRPSGPGASSSFLASPLLAAAGKSAASTPLVIPGGDLSFWDDGAQKKEPDFADVDIMKERFAKLLLGEDMSGSGQGVCTALAISNAITNLSELWRLEPLAPQRKSLWRREMEWLLSVCDYIVDFMPSLQEFPGGGTFEVMVSRPRADLCMSLPALKKLDAMLIGMLDGFRDTEFWYVDRGILVPDGDEESSGACSSSSLGRPSLRQEDKWWLPCPRVPANGLSENARKMLQQCRDFANQILKAAMAINSGVLAEMEIPDVYLETLPKSGKTCLGEIIYRYITAEQFSPECLLDCLDLSAEHYTLEKANKIEAAIYVWRFRDRRKSQNQSKAKKSSWSGKVKGLVNDFERRQFLAERAECLLQSLRRRYPALPQTALDMSKIQYNKDVGQSILESYSRVMESLAFNIMARIDDVIYVDDTTRKSAATEAESLFNTRGLGGLPIQKKISPSPFSIHSTPYVSPFATPAFCSSTPVAGSPGRTQLSLSKINPQGKQEEKLGKLVSGELEKLWSYTGNLSSRKDAGDAPERD